MQQENIDLIMDVPLEVTVELGRTNKSIKEILDFAPGTIIELDKLAGCCAIAGSGDITADAGAGRGAGAGSGSDAPLPPIVLFINLL